MNVCDIAFQHYNPIRRCNPISSVIVETVPPGVNNMRFVERVTVRLVIIEFREY